MTPEPALIPVLEIAEELGTDIPEAHRGDAVQRAHLLSLRLRTGDGCASALLDGVPDLRGRVGNLLVARGLLVGQVSLAGRTATQLLGPGDLLSVTSDGELLPYSREFVATQDATVAVLDDRFLGLAQRWPWIAGRLLEGAARQLERAAVHQAICQLSRVELRLLALMWHACERWGRVTPDGLSINLRLTHSAIGQLIGAKRPTVSLALKWLAEEGALTRRDNGDWLVNPTSSTLLTSGARPAERSRPVLAHANGNGRGADVGLYKRLERLRRDGAARDT